MDEQDTQNGSMTPQPETQADRGSQTTPASMPAGKTAWSMKNNSMFTMVVALIVVIVAGAAAFYIWHSRAASTSATAGSTNYPAVVAVVNGEEITASDLKKSVTQTQNVAQQQGADLTDPKVQAIIQSQALSLLVNAKLLVQAASKAGINASSSEVDAQYAAIEQQFGGADKLQAQMKLDGLTEADLKQNIEQQIVIKAYLAMNPSYANATVTDAEVTTAYNTYKAQSSSTPALDQISSQIKDQLLQQKQQDAINAIIDTLRASSTIKTNV